MLLLTFAITSALFILLERVIPARKQAFWRRGFIADLLYIPINLVARIAVNFVLATLLTELGREVLPSWSLGLLAGAPLWMQALAVIVIIDFIFYWTHRANHSWGWWWSLHETHHSARELDWLSTVRFHPLEKLLDRLLNLVPLLVLGAGDSALLIWSSVDGFFGILNHANTRVRLGPLIYLFVGPEMHLWHHARDPRHGQVNFGNNLSIFDWMFGTAYVADGLPDRFGIEDDAYPVDDIVAQFTYPFRKLAATSRAGPVVAPLEEIPAQIANS